MAGDVRLVLAPRHGAAATGRGRRPPPPLVRAIAYQAAAVAEPASLGLMARRAPSNGTAAAGAAALRQQPEQQQVVTSADLSPGQLAALSPRMAAEVAEGLAPAELQRRLKISAANRGKTPWNKGRTHSPATLERIRQRTREAMSRPEVRERLRLANQHRPGHTAEAKAKIRAKLRAKVEVEREAIERETARILEQLERSEDEGERAAAAHPRATRIISGMAWQTFKKLQDYEILYQHWNEPGSVLRERSLAKIKRQAEALATRRARPRPARVKKALELVQKLEQARAKLATAESTAALLQAALPGLAAARDPRHPAIVVKAAQTQELVGKLQERIEMLEEVLEPLQPLLDDIGSSGGGEAAAAAALRGAPTPA